jgi:hypothetical protein
VRLLAFLCGFCQVSTAILPYTAKLLGEPSELVAQKTAASYPKRTWVSRKKERKQKRKKAGKNGPDSGQGWSRSCL